VILGYNTILTESLADRLTPDEQDTLQESVASCKRLIRLVNSMLDVSQIESGKLQMNLAPADLRQVVSSVERLFRHDASAHNIGLRVQMPTRLPRLNADAERIQQVLINLVGNALKFTPSGGQITISVGLTADTQAVEIAVRDTGIGISAEDQQRIFDEFALGRHPRRHPGQGAGLGLAIARRIVQAHRGRLEVSSKPGQGSTFWFTLPLKRPRVIVKEAVSA
jgi:signal transduction histidine kinase